MLIIVFFALLFSEPKPLEFSYYQAVPAQTNSDPTTSSCGPTLKPWQQIAIHRHYRNNGFNCGDLVLILNSGFGFRILTVNDVTAAHIAQDRWDILVGNNEPAMIYGIDEGFVWNLRTPLDLITRLVIE